MHRISVILASLLSLGCLIAPASAYELKVQRGVNVWSPTPLPPPPVVQVASPVQVQVNVTLREDDDCEPVIYAQSEGYPGYVGGHLDDRRY
ncbi:MAG: hypothetical protein NWR47_00380 [Aestuariivirgaceae bacterium]|nr:hypothetical protein [Aestuariivirgaceae bacterium]